MTRSRGESSTGTVPLLALAAVLACAASAHGSEQSELLYSRGLVRLHDGKLAEASDLFDRAVAADPDDVYALYYRGVTRARLGRYDAAIEDLKTVAERRPDLDQAPLQLGIALVKAGRYEEAVPWLDRAQRAPPVYAEASFYLGIAELRLGRYQEAAASLTRAERDPELATAAHYYQGVVAYQQRQWKEAAEHFSAVVRRTPGSAMGGQAADFLDKLKAEERPRVNVYGQVGFEYDSNVVLAPSNETIKNSLGISNQDDGRAVIDVGGTYVPWRTERAELQLGYEFYQSLQFHLTSFDLQDHRPSVQLTYQTDRARFGFAAQYDYDLLETSSFLQGVEALPWIVVPEAGLGRTELYYRFRWRAFYQQPYESLLDAYNYSPGIRQLFYIRGPQRYAWLGYRFDRQDPINSAGRQFGYDGNEASVGIGWALPLQVAAQAGYAYRSESYDGTSRHDDEHRLSAVFERGITGHLGVVVGYYGMFNDSNEKAYRYERHIASVALRASF
jgi:tetratricopeptide (TPR) repeat protein